MKIKLKTFFTCILAIVLLVSTSGCALDSNLLSQINTASPDSEQGLSLPQDGKNGTNGVDGKDGKDGDSIDLYKIYEQLVDLGQFSGDYSDFVKEYLGDQQSGTLATNKALNSVVSIYAGFTSSVSYYSSPISIKTFERKNYSIGAGVIFRLDKETGDAYIITNYHVVYDSTSDSISSEINLLIWGKEYHTINPINSVKDIYDNTYTYNQFESQYGIPATYLGGSLLYDIAVLKVTGSDILKTSSATAADFADSDTTTVGETAIAIGNPSGNGISATNGIVSVDSEYIVMPSADNRLYCEFRVIRTDAAVNAGNSGGGLFNSDGELLGIVNAKINSFTIENIGYAIPSNIAQNVAKNIIKNCDGENNTNVIRCLIGINVAAINSSAHFDGTKTYITETVAVDKITAGSVSEGYFELGDILTSVTINYTNGSTITKAITRTFTLIDLSLTLSVGDTITITRTAADGTAKPAFSFTFTEAETQAYA